MNGFPLFCLPEGGNPRNSHTMLMLSDKHTTIAPIKERNTAGERDKEPPDW